MQQVMLQQQQLYHSGVLAAAMSQMEPVPSGNLPPGFDPSTCRSVYVGNIHPNVAETLLAEVFQSIGPLEGCKLIRKEKSSFGFVDYHDRRSAALAISTLHGRQLYGQAIKVNWAYASGQREDTSGHFHIFVGDLSPEVTDSTLFACFSAYSSCSDARVMWDTKTGRSRGFGFVSFRNQQDAQSAINDMQGKWLGNKQIRCNWATKNSGEEKQSSDNQNAMVLMNASSDSVEEVHIQRDKGFGFVRYNSHKEAALAIQMANGKIVCGKSMKCSWGTKPTPQGTSSNPLPPPMPSFQVLPTPGVPQGYTAAELLAYQRQLLFNQVAAAAAAAGPMAGQHSLAAHASAGLISGGSQTMYDGYPSHSSAAHQLM